jgi:peroxiredoxin
MKKLIFTLALTLISYLGFNQCLIEGTEPTWAEKEIYVSTITDPICRSETELARTRISKDGSFLINLNISELTRVFISAGVYRIELQAEPNKNYKISLPALKIKTEVDQLNPFFKETELYVQTNSSDTSELNLKVAAFIDFYDDYISQNSLYIAKMGKKSNVDTAIVMIDSLFPVYSHAFFKQVVYYKKAALRYFAYENDEKSVLSTYFANQPILWQNFAYWEMFENVVRKYFSPKYKNPASVDVSTYLSMKNSYSQAFTYLKTQLNTGNDEFIELMLLKNLNDAFYSETLKHETVWAMLDSIKESSKSLRIRQISTNITEKTHRLLAGSMSPAFELADLDGKKLSLSQFKGNFVYIQFFSAKSFACQQDLSALEAFYTAHAKEIQILTIICDQDYSLIKEAIKTNKYKWKFALLNGDYLMLKAFKVRTFPTYYLIDPDGKLAISPATPPNEEFEDAFGKLFLNYKNNKIRDKYKNEKR